MKNLFSNLHLPIAVTALLFVIAPQFPSYANQTAQSDDNWTFVKGYFHETDHSTWMRNSFSALPVDAADFYSYLYQNQYNGVGVARCTFRDSGSEYRPFDISRETVSLLSESLKENYIWLLDENFSPFAYYANGPLLDRDPLKPPFIINQNVNYFFCRESGMMGTTGFTPVSESSLAISVGRAGAQMHKHKPWAKFATTHELFHVYQLQHIHATHETDETPLKKPAFHWITEATASAVAMKRVDEIYGDFDGIHSHPDTISNYSNFSRTFFRQRPYNLPLNILPTYSREIRAVGENAQARALINSVGAYELRMIAYRTETFWYHVVERYLKDKPGNLDKFFKSLSEEKLRNATKAVDDYLDDQDGTVMNGLEHVYPQFATEYASWPVTRVKSKFVPGEWLFDNFGNCKIFTLTMKDTTATHDFEIAPYASGCFYVRVSEALSKTRPDLHIAFESDKSALIDDLYLGDAITLTRSGENKDVRNFSGCIEVVEAAGPNNPAPCLLNPMQGVELTGSKAKYTRSFYDTNLPYENFTKAFIIARSPSDHKDTPDRVRTDPVKITVSATFGVIENRSLNKNSNAIAQVKYGRQQTRSPITPASGGAFDGSSMLFESILNGEMTPAQLGAIGEGIDHTIAINMEGDGTSLTVSAIAQQPIEDLALLGPQKVTALVERKPLNRSDDNGIIGIQDPENASMMTIEELNDGTMRFVVDANACEYAPRLLEQAVLSGRPFDPCIDGVREHYTLTGAVAFPKLVSGRSKWEAHKTPNLAAYQEFRSYRFKRKSDNTAITSGGRTAGGQGTSENSSTSNSTGEEPLCKLRDSNDRCDCSCKAARCVMENIMQLQNSLDIECMQQCSDQWDACAP